MKISLPLPAPDFNVPFCQQSLDQMVSKYLLPGETFDGMRTRISTALASVEQDPAYWQPIFYWALQFSIPGGRVTSNIGAGAWKPKVSTINCTVSRTIDDSMTGILDAVKEAGITLKAGCGIGYDFSTLRPKGAPVKGAGAYTNGPIPFMRIFDTMCQTVSSAGGRRGAQMGVMVINHPDIEDFITSKTGPGAFLAFNLSTLVTNEFLEHHEAKTPFPLYFPAFAKEIEDGCEVLWRYWPLKSDLYSYNEEGQVACKVYKRLDPVQLWDTITKTTFNSAEPGIIFIDRINEMNNLWFCEDIRATNPCGEQPLPPWAACLLGSNNLTQFVRKAFTNAASFDWDLYKLVVRVFSRMLDNVCEMNGLPLPQQQAEMMRKRRHGMGFLGLGSALAMMGVRYGSDEAVEFTEEVSKQMAVESWRAALELAKEKGPAPIMLEEFEVTPEMVFKRPELLEHLGQKLRGSVLHAKYSRHMQQIAKIDPALVEELAEVGARYSHATSLAPTGTIAYAMANNASGGIEPTYSAATIRYVIVPGKPYKKDVFMESFELQAYRHLVDPNVSSIDPPEFLRNGTCDYLTPADHIRMQGAAQKWIDSAISKTVNVPADITFEEFQGVYTMGIDANLKGCTTYRPSPGMDSVLNTIDSRSRCQYELTLDDGTTVKGDGNTYVKVGEDLVSLAVIYNAHKQGYQGRH